MKQGGSKRKRCSECRCWFVPVRTAAKSQRVCGEECRRGRRRGQARSRRAERVQDYRVDERERQRACRARRKGALQKGAGAAAGGGGHAPPSSANGLEFVEKVLESWDEAAALSRAALARGIAAILRRSGPIEGTEEAALGALSRTTLGP